MDNHFAPIEYGSTFGNARVETHARSSTTTQYAVYFRVRFPTTSGEDVGVIGELPELGGWDVTKCLKLKWNADHYWETTTPLMTT
jgi:hypothetical protein